MIVGGQGHGRQFHDLRRDGGQRRVAQPRWRGELAARRQGVVGGERGSAGGGNRGSRLAAEGSPGPDLHDIGVTVKGGTTVLTSPRREIFASRDRGESWRGLGVADRFQLGYCRHLAQKADDPETLFVATGNGATGDAGAIQRSRDGGRNWQMLSLPAEPNSPIWAFATHIADPGLIVACSHSRDHLAK